MRPLAVDEFLDMLLDMPDIEARQEIDLRKSHMSLQLAMLNAELLKVGKKSKRGDAIGSELFIIAHDLAQLNLRRKEINDRMDRTSWAKAVTAIYGQEGFSACREWMAMYTDVRAK